MDYGTPILLLLVGFALVGLIKLIQAQSRLRLLYADWQEFQEWRATRPDVPPLPGVATGAVPAAIDTRILRGAGTALLNPPSDLRVSMAALQQRRAGPAYAFPLGWRMINEQQHECVSAALVGDVNHILLTGFTDCGKDSWAASMLLSLAVLNSPSKVQFAIIDGKGGLSWIGWGEKEHVWLMAESMDDIPTGMQTLKTERERRQTVLKLARCEKWDEYTGGDLPLITVFVSELMLLQDATSKAELADWLNTELTSARAAGIRYIVSGQTVTRLDTRWRSQIGLYIAGYQPRDDADEPNTSFSTKDLLKFGTNPDGTVVGVPPSMLPVPPAGQGVFTCVQGRTVITVRSTYVNKQQRQWLLDQLPDKPLQVAAPEPAPVAASASDADMLVSLLQSSSWRPAADQQQAPASLRLSTAEREISTPPSSLSTLSTSTPPTLTRVTVEAQAPLLISTDKVPAEEQRRILDAAQQVSSRTKLCQELYGSRGGPKYTWIQLVCDAAGLLVSSQPQEQAA